MVDLPRNTKVPLWSGSQSRQITKRIVVECDLVLQTPAHFGSGDEAGSLVPLIVDELTQQPLLTGASIAGALRSYLWTVQYGYGCAQTSEGVAALLFGGSRQDNDGHQSRLIVNDAYGKNTCVELRDGVKINSKSRTADEGKLYTFMVWAAGATFRLRFELLITENDDQVQLRQALAVALDGLQTGEVTLGARKRRGYGRVSVAVWYVREFELTNHDELLAWVRDEDTHMTKKHAVGDLFEALHVSTKLEDKRERFMFQGLFNLQSSLLIRAESTVTDMGHMRSRGKPVLSGTSLSGAIRARALKIANTLEIPDAEILINAMFGIFGDEAEDKRTASRVFVEEHLIEGGESEQWAQSRVSIDRFTGGALDTALFDQQPQFGGQVHVNLELRKPADREIGLLLLVWKDLWAGDLPLGGESSVGRGRLNGQSATLTYQLTYQKQTWILTASEAELSVNGDKPRLEAFVAALLEKQPT